MVKEKKRGDWLAFLRGGVTALSLYLVGNLILALVMVEGHLPEQVGFTSLSGLGFVSAAVGGVVAARRSLWATLPSALLTAVMVVLVLVIAGALIWPETFWKGRSIIRVLSILAGGLIAGIWSARKRKGKSGRSRTAFR